MECRPSQTNEGKPPVEMQIPCKHYKKRKTTVVEQDRNFQNPTFKPDIRRTRKTITSNE